MHFSIIAVVLVCIIANIQSSVILKGDEIQIFPSSEAAMLVSANGPGIKSLTSPNIRRNCNMFARKSCICGMNFKPLCGSDGITYANYCQFQCAQRCGPALTFGRCGTCWQKSNSLARSCLP